MKELEKKKQLLNKIKTDLKSQYGVTRIGIFGSHARDEAHEDSDIDILVDLDGSIGLMKFVELENYLSEILGCKVDLVISENLKPQIGKNILREVIQI